MCVYVCVCVCVCVFVCCLSSLNNIDNKANISKLG